MEKKKRRSRRDMQKYPALKRNFNLKTRYDEIDFDYVEKLSEEDKAWLNSFAEEYIGANLNHKGEKLHKTKKLKKDVYDRNNARNRCVLTRSKAQNKAILLSELPETISAGNEEDKLIEQLDNQKLKRFFRKIKKNE